MHAVNTARHRRNCWDRFKATDANEFRKLARSAGLSHRTIEDTISEMNRQGIIDKVGNRLRVVNPDPDPPTLREIAIFYRAIEEAATWRSVEWWKCLIAIGLWTGLRRGDLVWLRWDDVESDRIRTKAHKTSKNHGIPLTPPIMRHLESIRHDGEYLFQPTRTYKQFNTAFTKISDAAGVKVTCQLLRQRSITMWTSHNAIAGQLIHGCLINSVLNHYIDRRAILESTATQISLPDCFLTKNERTKSAQSEQALLAAYRRANKSTKATILDVARKMA